MLDTAAPTEPCPGNLISAAELAEEAAELRARLPKIGREAEVAYALLFSMEDDVARQMNDAEFRRILGTEAALVRIKDAAAIDDLPSGSSGAPAAVESDERNRWFWLNKAREYEGALSDIAEEAEVAKVLLSSLEAVAADRLDPAIFLRLVGALDAVRRIQALAPAGPDA